MSAKHTPEPWAIDSTREIRGGEWATISSSGVGATRIGAWGEFVEVVVRMNGDSEDSPAGLANAARIVACVNACAGIPMETLERMKNEPCCVLLTAEHDRQISQLLTLRKQRDELVKALRLYADAGFGNSTDFHLQGAAYDAAVKAIAKAAEASA